MERISLFGLGISDVGSVTTVVDEMAKFLDNPNKAWLVTFVNPHAWFVQENDQDYARRLAEFDLVLADGIGVVKATSWLSGATIERMSFDASSLYHPVFKHLNDRSAKLYIVGGVEGVAATAAERMQERFPGIRIVGLSHGYQPSKTIINDVLRSEAEMVLCGMGVPHQETFLLRLKQSGFLGVAFTCGGFLDQLAAKEQYYPDWADKSNLRWIYRIYREPRRLWRRYVFQYQPFIRATLWGLWQKNVRKVRHWGEQPNAASVKAETHSQF